MSLRDKLPQISTLQERLASLKEKSNLKSGNLLFWLSKPTIKDTVNTATIRILPHPKYNYDSFIETWVHYGMGDYKTVTCPKLNGHDESCAICDHYFDLYKMADEVAKEHKIDSKDKENNYVATKYLKGQKKTINVGDRISGYEAMMEVDECSDLRKLAKSIRPVKRVYTPILIRGKEHEGVKFYGFNDQFYNKLFNDCIKVAAKWSKKSPLNPYEGTDIELNFSNDGSEYGDISYSIQTGDDPTSCIPNKTEEEIDAIIAVIPDVWGNICKKTTSEEVENMVNNLMGPNGIIDITTIANTEDKDEVEKEPSTTKVTKHSTGISESTKKATSKALAEIDEIDTDMSIDALNDEI